jgi:hypothetical protein
MLARPLVLGRHPKLFPIGLIALMLARPLVLGRHPKPFP